MSSSNCNLGPDLTGLSQGQAKGKNQTSVLKRAQAVQKNAEAGGRGLWKQKRRGEGDRENYSSLRSLLFHLNILPDVRITLKSIWQMTK